MRQILSTAVTAVIVSLLTLTVAGAMAQSEPPASSTTISPSAVSDINADRVDGKHAVGAGATIQQRRGKLVATDKTGFLPRNIVKPLWPLIQHMPAGFADGVDDSHVNGVLYTDISLPGQGSALFMGAQIPSPNVLLTVEPVSPDTILKLHDVSTWLDGQGRYWATWHVDNLSITTATFSVRYVDFGTGSSAPTRSELKAARTLEKGKVRKSR